MLTYRCARKSRCVHRSSEKKAAQSGLLAEADAVGALGAKGAADAFGAAGAADACGCAGMTAGAATDEPEAAELANEAGAPAASAEAALAAPSGVSAGKVCKGGGGSTATGSASGRIHAATAKAATNRAAMAPKGVLFFCSVVAAVATL